MGWGRQLLPIATGHCTQRTLKGRLKPRQHTQLVPSAYHERRANGRACASNSNISAQSPGKQIHRMILSRFFYAAQKCVLSHPFFGMFFIKYPYPSVIGTGRELNPQVCNFQEAVKEAYK
jgi:hypothetical protein